MLPPAEASVRQSQVLGSGVRMPIDRSTDTLSEEIREIPPCQKPHGYCFSRHALPTGKLHAAPGLPHLQFMFPGSGLYLQPKAG